MALRVLIGHASGDENGNIKGGIAGDQTAKEVRISNWYPHTKGWVCFRANDVAIREKIAEAMEKACNNPMIGYDQAQRDSLFTNVKTQGFDPSKTTKKVETDCSALVRVCVAYACGKDVIGNVNTSTLPAALMNTGLFIKSTDDMVTKSSDHLVRGDILCTPVKGHVVVVLDNGAKAPTSITATEPARFFDPAFDATFITTAGLNVRNGAGTTANDFGDDKSILIKLAKGTEVKCFGSYNLVDNRKWLHVHFAIDGVTYTGFASTKYLTKA